MPTESNGDAKRNTKERLENAKLRLRAAQEEHATFTNRQFGGFIEEDLLEHKRLLENLREAMAEYWRLFKEAAQSTP